MKTKRNEDKNFARLQYTYDLSTTRSYRLSITLFPNKIISSVVFLVKLVDKKNFKQHIANSSIILNFQFFSPL